MSKKTIYFSDYMLMTTLLTETLSLNKSQVIDMHAYGMYKYFV